MYMCMLRHEKGFGSPGTVATIGIYEAFSVGVGNQMPVLCKSVKGSLAPCGWDILMFRALLHIIVFSGGWGWALAIIFI